MDQASSALLTLANVTLLPLEMTVGARRKGFKAGLISINLTLISSVSTTGLLS